MVSKRKCSIDRLSALPDDVLHRVLSSVDFLVVVRNSVLSKRWRNLWKSMPYLNFDLDCFCKYKKVTRRDFTFNLERHKFWDFANRAVVSRDDSQILRLSVEDDGAYHEINEFLLRVASIHRVQEFRFFDKMDDGNTLVIPRNLCETLISLKLKSHVSLQVDAVFSNLRSLNMRGHTMSSDVAERLLSSECIKLEDVYLEDCLFEEDFELFNISACDLKNLTFVNVCTCNFIWRTVEKSFKSKLRICAPNLLSFYYIGPMLSGFEFVGTKSLKRVSIRLAREFREFKNHLYFPEMFIGLSHVKSLALSTLVVKYSSRAYSKHLWDTFVLKNLNRLELELRYSANYIEGMINLLKCMPNLDILVIRFQEVSLPGENEMKEGYLMWMATYIARSPWKSRIEDIECLSSHIKTIQISNLDDSDFAFEFVKFLLENGQVLKNMEIMYKSGAEHEMESLSKKLLALTNVSSEVTVCFVEYDQRQLPWLDRGNSDSESDD